MTVLIIIVITVICIAPHLTEKDERTALHYSTNPNPDMTYKYVHICIHKM